MTSCVTCCCCWTTLRPDAGTLLIWQSWKGPRESLQVGGCRRMQFLLSPATHFRGHLLQHAWCKRTRPRTHGGWRGCWPPQGLPECRLGLHRLVEACLDAAWAPSAHPTCPLAAGGREMSMRDAVRIATVDNYQVSLHGTTARTAHHPTLVSGTTRSTPSPLQRLVL